MQVAQGAEALQRLVKDTFIKVLVKDAQRAEAPVEQLHSLTSY